MSNSVNIADIREDYEREGLLEAGMLGDPLVQFNQWMQSAIDAKLWQPNACTLATATKDGRPSARIILLKEVNDRGFVFYTNYTGRKGRELAENPQAALVFMWPEFSRQVRVSGLVEQVDSATSDAYFAVRPRGSRLGAWASPQSEVVENREALENAMRSYEEKYAGDEVPRPPHWGGYCLIPDTIEFWQGRPSRLHDRLVYSRVENDNWKLERLAP